MYVARVLLTSKEIFPITNTITTKKNNLRDTPNTSALLRARERERDGRKKNDDCCPLCSGLDGREEDLATHQSLGARDGGFRSQTKREHPWIWDCIVPGKPGTIFADGRFPVVLDFRKSSCIGLPTAHVPEEFGSNLEIREKHLDNQQFEGVPISCDNTVWGLYALALRCLYRRRNTNTSIKTILLKVQESKFTSFENYDDKCYGKEEWTHIIAKYVPKVDEKRGGGSPNAVLPNTATSAVSSKRTRKENHRNATTIRREVPKELWEEQAFNWDDYCVLTSRADDIEKITREYPNLRTPCLCLDWDQVERNIGAMLRLVKCVENWRPHVKTTKMTLVWNLLLEKGVFKFKCSTIKELHYLLATIEHHEVAKQKEGDNDEKKEEDNSFNEAEGRIKVRCFIRASARFKRAV